MCATTNKHETITIPNNMKRGIYRDLVHVSEKQICPKCALFYAFSQCYTAEQAPHTHTTKNISQHGLGHGKRSEPTSMAAAISAIGCALCINSCSDLLGNVCVQPKANHRRHCGAFSGIGNCSKIY